MHLSLFFVQVFLVVTDSVLKQLDGLKNDPAARPAVRRFLGQGLDACGPAGAPPQEQRSVGRRALRFCALCAAQYLCCASFLSGRARPPAPAARAPCLPHPHPAGADFLTVLGAHEGEGLLVEHDAAVSPTLSGHCTEGWCSVPFTAIIHPAAPAVCSLQVAGSRSADVSTKGQRADQRIVEVRRGGVHSMLQGPSGSFGASQLAGPLGSLM